MEGERGGGERERSLAVYKKHDLTLFTTPVHVSPVTDNNINSEHYMTESATVRSNGWVAAVGLSCR